MSLESFKKDTDSTDTENTDENGGSECDADIIFNTKGEIKGRSEKLSRGTESTEHFNKKCEVALDLVQRGYNVSVEQPYMDYVIDVYAEKSGVKLIIEIGTTVKYKVQDIKSNSDKLIFSNIPYSKDGDEVGCIIDKAKRKTSLRPKIDYWFLRQMQMETTKAHSNEDRNLVLYELGGYSSQSEFLRTALREKIEEHKHKYDIE